MTALGEKIGRIIPGGTILAVHGTLGAGKTTFVKGIARGLGICEEITSPTYTIISEYEGRLRLYHMDAYRLAGSEDFRESGGEEYFDDPGAVCIIEWAERIASSLPSRASSIDIQIMTDGSRLLRMDAPILEGLMA
jgi:tRNA threonylcarbamoyladenosine biosynthesis protein TsaE